MAGLSKFSDIKEKARTAVHQSIEEVLQKEQYAPAQVQEWMDNIAKKSIEELSKLSSYFKYTATCFVVQKVGAGAHVTAASLWDPEQDGYITARWENQSMLCYVVAFACAL
uniref:Dynein light chain n=1 Tax=Fibrocapsa japonica TaxID=94617 RepID=A0A7S2Y105_9STRA|mmetsp:Transcript_20561/g.29756  ORF Transcript_20561/g.29756 Transcript_20561/m.29756 type:complete len:111 (+) Transcript_20561:49-381(+)|eukprot:CAMPEP_0113952778 /NCGR_PEP_ID=MMETSP1339-20121228/90615_1 /TAXON_ID=94617 /ORGANISM="Fibrocapsa japonica" /LENGTH=110 /DNA_ID=CAMNT_0000961441 /DNA_START=40 /DNA_END=372 /DNA_ORIENTATION=- /assembly_acc=CAM_ASM_000762